jgi:DNA-binding MarR family transcriptional regulator
VRLQLVPAIHRATHRIALHLDATAPPLDASQGEAHLLAFLHEAGTSSVAELHDAFAHKRSTLTSYLDRLEGKGLATRRVHPDDRRSFLVALTPAGRTLAARVHARLEELEDAALAHLSERDLRGFQAVLHAVQEHIETAPNRRPAAARRRKP